MIRPPKLSVLLAVVLFEAVVTGLLAGAVALLSTSGHYTPQVTFIAVGMALVKGLGHLVSQFPLIRKSLRIPEE